MDATSSEKSANGMICSPLQSLDIAWLGGYEVFKGNSGASRSCSVRCYMDFDGEKLEQVVLAWFQMNLSDDSGRRAWKSLPWSVMDSLHQKGYISDPATKNKSVGLSEEGAKLSKELFEKLFAPA